MQNDRAELHDLAAEQPDKVRELINLWFAEAGANGAFPLDDRSAVEILNTPRPQLAGDRDRYLYYPGTAGVPTSRTSASTTSTTSWGCSSSTWSGPRTSRPART